jgi:hypothetical protein
LRVGRTTTLLPSVNLDSHQAFICTGKGCAVDSANPTVEAFSADSE